MSRWLRIWHSGWEADEGSAGMFLMAPFWIVAVGIAGLATIPTLLHLMHRQRTTPIAWGAMQFLLDTPLKQKRRQRLDHWLLMLVRMALLALVVAMLARPLLLAGPFNPLSTDTPADVAIIIDHSLSMGRHVGNGDQTLLDRAVDEVTHITTLMRKSDTLSLVLAEHTPRKWTPFPVAGELDIDRLRADLRNLRPGTTDASIPDAIQAANDLLARGRHSRKIILVLSDEQRSTWSADNPSAWRLALGEHPAGDSAAEIFSLPLIPATMSVSNISIGRIAFLPGLIGVNRPVQITAAVTNTGSAAVQTVPLQLTVDGQLINSQTLSNIDPGQTQTVRFDYAFTSAGPHWTKISTDIADALLADNAAVAALNVVPKLPVLVIDGQLRPTPANFPHALFLLAALSPGDSPAATAATLIQPKVISVSDADRMVAGDFAQYPAIVLNDVPALSPTLLAKLTDFSLSGHGLWILLGPRTDRAFFDSLPGRSPLFPVRFKSNAPDHAAPSTAPQNVGIVVKDRESPMVSLLIAEQQNAFTGVVLSKWWSLNVPDSEHVVLASTAGDPLVMDHAVGNTGGRVVIWALPALPENSNLPLVSNFVPLVNETIFHLSATMTKTQNRQLDAGTPITLTLPSTPMIESVQITKPDASTVGLNPALTNGNYLISYPETALPGLYEMKFTPPDAGLPGAVYFSVNLDPRELEPAILTQADLGFLSEHHYLTKRLDNVTELPGALGAENRGTDLWPYLALLVLATLLFETMLTHRAMALQTPGTALAS